MYNGEGTNPDDVVTTRRILVTDKNLMEIAKDIQMSPTDLALMYMNCKLANRQLVIEVVED